MQNLIREEEKSIEECPNFLISDDDIAHRNSINWREAEAIWEISSVLGVVFDKDKNEMIDIFQRLEEEDLRARAS
ncbi:hypothetical protein DITRI_Ditri14bG0151000 [Diplodiscus trichospermus]